MNLSRFPWRKSFLETRFGEQNKSGGYVHPIDWSWTSAKSPGHLVLKIALLFCPRHLPSERTTSIYFLETFRFFEFISFWDRFQFESFRIPVLWNLKWLKIDKIFFSRVQHFFFLFGCSAWSINFEVLYIVFSSRISASFPYSENWSFPPTQIHRKQKNIWS